MDIGNGQNKPSKSISSLKCCAAGAELMNFVQQQQQKIIELFQQCPEADASRFKIENRHKQGS